MKNRSVIALNYNEIGEDSKPPKFKFEMGEWYSSLDPADWVKHPSIGPILTPMYCAKVHPSGYGMVVSSINNRAEARWWTPGVHIIKVENPTGRTDEMAIRKNLTEQDLQDQTRIVEQIIGVNTRARDQDTALDNSSDKWIVDETTEALSALADRLDSIDEAVTANVFQTADMVANLHLTTKSLRRDLDDEYQKRMELEGRIEAHEAKKSYGDNPLLWDRLTGEGPFIEVPMDDLYNRSRGMISVYRGEAKTSTTQARGVVWRESLTTVPPGVTNDDSDYGKMSIPAQVVIGTVVGLISTLAAVGGHSVIMALFAS